MRRVSLLASLVLTVSLASLASLASTAAAQRPGDRGTLVSGQSGLCLAGSGTPVARACDPGAAVTLAPVAGAPGAFQVRNDRTGWCLFSNGDGRFGWFGCTAGSADQTWGWLATDADGAALRAFHSGRCVSSERDGRTAMVDCAAAAAGQRWHVGVPGPALPPPVVADAIVGDWDWWNGVATAFHADGTFVLANDGGGRWRALGRGRYEVGWGDGRVERVRLSGDGTTLDVDGIHTGRSSRTAARRRMAVVVVAPPPPADCGTGPSDAGCAESRGGIVAMRADAFTGLMAGLRATGSELTKRDMVLAATRASGLTAAQLMQILDLFRSELTQLDVVRGVAARVVDPPRALGYAARLRSNGARAELVRLLSGPTAPPPAPPPVCAPMPACGLRCAYGLAVDANGCALCTCNSAPGVR